MMAHQAQDRSVGVSRIPGVPTADEMTVVDPNRHGVSPAASTGPTIDRPIDKLPPAILDAVLEQSAFAEMADCLSALGRDLSRDRAHGRAAESIRIGLEILQELKVLREPAFLLEILPTETGRKSLMASLHGNFEHYNTLGAKLGEVRGSAPTELDPVKEFFAELEQLCEVFRERFSGAGLPLVEGVRDGEVGRIFRSLLRSTGVAVGQETPQALAVAAMRDRDADDQTRHEVDRWCLDFDRASQQLELRAACEGTSLEGGLSRVPSYDLLLARMQRVCEKIRTVAERPEMNGPVSERLLNLHDALYSRFENHLQRHEIDVRRSRGERVPATTPRGAILHRGAPTLESLIDFPAELRAKRFSTGRIERLLADGSGAMVVLERGEKAFLPRGTSGDLRLSAASKSRPLAVAVSGTRASPPQIDDEIVCACGPDQRGLRILAWTPAGDARRLLELLGYSVKGDR